MHSVKIHLVMIQQYSRGPSVAFQMVMSGHQKWEIYKDNHLAWLIYAADCIISAAPGCTTFKTKPCWWTILPYWYSIGKLLDCCYTLPLISASSNYWPTCTDASLIWASCLVVCIRQMLHRNRFWYAPTMTWLSQRLFSTLNIRLSASNTGLGRL